MFQTHRLCIIQFFKTSGVHQIFVVAVVCLKNGMRLFKADSKEARESLLNIANKEWSDLEDFITFIGQKARELACNSIEKDGEACIENGKTDCADKLCICEFVNIKPDEKLLIDDKNDKLMNKIKDFNSVRFSFNL